MYPKEGEPDPLRILTSLGAALLTGGLICLPFTGLDFGGYAARLDTYQGAITILGGAAAAVGAVALVWRYAPITSSAYRLGAAGAAGVVTLVVSGAMVLNSIVGHMLSAFGEYPWLTLNAYNPWALMRTSEGDAMVVDKAWVHDTAWTDAQAGGSGPGYLIGHFSGGWIVVLAGLLVVLAVAAFLAWRAAGRMAPQSADDVESGDVEPAVPEPAAVERRAFRTRGFRAGRAEISPGPVVGGP